MKRYFLTSVITLFCITFVSAQDDMYFGSSKTKSTTKTKVVASEVVDEDAPRRYALKAESSPSVSSSDAGSTSDYNPSDYCGSLRSVDEYNRRDRFNQSYAKSLEDSLRHEDSVVVSKEDYEYAMRMKKYDGYNNVVLIVNNDPWYDDPWYYDSYYYNRYWHTSFYDPFYRPWYDPWYDPWYRPWGTAWGLSYYSRSGWGISWGIGYHRPGWGGGYWHRDYYRPGFVGPGGIRPGYISSHNRGYSVRDRGGINSNRWSAGTRRTNVSDGRSSSIGYQRSQGRVADTATRPGNVSSRQYNTTSSNNRGFGSYEQRSQSNSTSSTRSSSSSYSGASRSSSSFGGGSGASRGGGVSSGASRGGGGFSAGASRGGARR